MLLAGKVEFFQGTPDVNAMILKFAAGVAVFLMQPWMREGNRNEKRQERVLL